MPTKLAPLALLFLVTACSGVCEDRSGTYRYAMTKRTGNCFDSQESLTSASPPDATGCSVVRTTSANNCQVTIKGQCENNGFVMKTSGVVNWSADGSRGTGTSEVSSTGSVVCQGTYDLTYERI